jgi:hypothetical protein
MGAEGSLGAGQALLQRQDAIWINLALEAGQEGRAGFGRVFKGVMRRTENVTAYAPCRSPTIHTAIVSASGVPVLQKSRS